MAAAASSQLVSYQGMIRFVRSGHYLSRTDPCRCQGLQIAFLLSLTLLLYVFVAMLIRLLLLKIATVGVSPSLLLVIRAALMRCYLYKAVASADQRK